jgi:hypothetical protein
MATNGVVIWLASACVDLLAGTTVWLAWLGIRYCLKNDMTWVACILGATAFLFVIHMAFELQSLVPAASR